MNNKLIIWNLANEVMQDDLLLAFEKNGVTRVDHHIGKYALLTFDYPYQAEDALTEWNGKVWRGRRIKARVANY